MAIISCKECSGKVSDTAATCPHCGAPVVAPMPAAVAPVAVEKSGGGWWKWVLGVPVGLFILMMVIGSLSSGGGGSAPDAKTMDRRVYQQCLSDLAAADRGRSSAATPMAGMCERFRSDYVKKYNATP